MYILRDSPGNSLSLESLQPFGTRQFIFGPGEHFSCQVLVLVVVIQALAANRNVSELGKIIDLES